MGFPLLHYSVTKVMSRACLCVVLHYGSLLDRFPFGRGAFTCAQERQVERSPVGLLRVRPRRRGRGLGRTTETGGQGRATGGTPLGSGLGARILGRVDRAHPEDGEWPALRGPGPSTAGLRPGAGGPPSYTIPSGGRLGGFWDFWRAFRRRPTFHPRRFSSRWASPARDQSPR